MAFWDGLKAFIGFGGVERNPGLQLPAPTGYSTRPSSPVNEETALQVSAVWACARLIAQTIASLPLDVFLKSPNGRKKTETHWFAQMMRGKVNRYQTRVEFWETVLLNLVLHGNAYCQIVRAGGTPIRLLPLMSSQVETRLLDDGSVVHYYRDQTGVTAYAAETIWHLKLFGNGIVGLSPLAYGRDMIGLAQSADQSVSNVFMNGGKPAGTLTTDQKLNREQVEMVREQFASLTSGTSDRLMALPFGLKFNSISLSPQDVQLLETRRFQLEEICRWFGVPSVLVNDTSSTTVWGSGIQQIVEGFYKLNLRPYLERIESSIETNLFSADDAKYEVEFNFDDLLRADMASRFAVYKDGVLSSVMTPNEARALEDMPKVPGGDELLAPVNMLPITQLGHQVVQTNPES